MNIMNTSFPRIEEFTMNALIGVLLSFLVGLEAGVLKDNNLVKLPKNNAAVPIIQLPINPQAPIIELPGPPVVTLPGEVPVNPEAPIIKLPGPPVVTLPGEIPVNPEAPILELPGPPVVTLPGEVPVNPEAPILELPGPPVVTLPGEVPVNPEAPILELPGPPVVTLPGEVPVNPEAPILELPGPPVVTLPGEVPVNPEAPILELPGPPVVTLPGEVPVNPEAPILELPGPPVVTLPGEVPVKPEIPIIEIPEIELPGPPGVGLPGNPENPLLELPQKLISNLMQELLNVIHHAERAVVKRGSTDNLIKPIDRIAQIFAVAERLVEHAKKINCDAHLPALGVYKIGAYLNHNKCQSYFIKEKLEAIAELENQIVEGKNYHSALFHQIFVCGKNQLETTQCLKDLVAMHKNYAEKRIIAMKKNIDKVENNLQKIKGCQNHNEKLVKEELDVILGPAKQCVTEVPVNPTSPLVPLPGQVPEILLPGPPGGSIPIKPELPGTVPGRPVITKPVNPIVTLPEELPGPPVVPVNPQAPIIELPGPPVVTLPGEVPVNPEAPIIKLPGPPLVTLPGEVPVNPEAPIIKLPGPPVVTLPGEVPVNPQAPIIKLPGPPVVTLPGEVPVNPQAPILELPGPPVVTLPGEVPVLPEIPIIEFPQNPIVTLPGELPRPPIVTLPGEMPVVPEFPTIELPGPPVVTLPGELPRPPIVTLPGEIPVVPEFPTIELPGPPVVTLPGEVPVKPEIPIIEIPEIELPGPPGVGLPGNPENPILVLPEKQISNVMAQLLSVIQHAERTIVASPGSGNHLIASIDRIAHVFAAVENFVEHAKQLNCEAHLPSSLGIYKVGAYLYHNKCRSTFIKEKLAAIDNLKTQISEAKAYRATLFKQIIVCGAKQSESRECFRKLYANHENHSKATVYYMNANIEKVENFERYVRSCQADNLQTLEKDLDRVLEAAKKCVAEVSVDPGVTLPGELPRPPIVTLPGEIPVQPENPILILPAKQISNMIQELKNAINLASSALKTTGSNSNLLGTVDKIAEIFTDAQNLVEHAKSKNCEAVIPPLGVYQIRAYLTHNKCQSFFLADRQDGIAALNNQVPEAKNYFSILFKEVFQCIGTEPGQTLCYKHVYDSHHANVERVIMNLNINSQKVQMYMKSIQDCQAINLNKAQGELVQLLAPLKQCLVQLPNVEKPIIY